MSFSTDIYSKSNVVAAALCLGVTATLPAHAEGTPMTAGVIMEKMKAGDRAVYVVGLVDGFAYARFRKDSADAGSKDETGMQCIYSWFYKDSMAAMDRVEAAFKSNAEHLPSVVMAAILKKECGE